MSGKCQVRFLAPSYLMYGDETGQTSAIATFHIGGTLDGTKKVPIPTNKYIQVGGGPIGGPELISVQILGDSIQNTIFPDKDFTAGAHSWSVLNRPSPGLGAPYELSVRTGCLIQQVPFSTFPPIEGSIVSDPVLILNDGEIINDLDAGQLAVFYITNPYNGTEGKETPFVPRAGDTGGVLSGAVISFDIKTSEGSVIKFRPEKYVQSTPKFPVGVCGELEAPRLAVVRPWPQVIEFVDLVRI